MRRAHRSGLETVVAAAAALLVVQVTGRIVLGYRDYFPPDFSTGFLQDRGGYFYGGYHWAFATHLVSGPLSIVLGTLLMSGPFRRRLPRWHRRLGRLQILNVLFFVTPSGLWMAGYARAGPSAGLSLGLLAFVTAATAIAGWRSAAVARDFEGHRRWMTRNYLLLCSAVVIRILGGVGEMLPDVPPWYDVAITWASWAVPLCGFEAAERLKRRPSIFPDVRISP